MRSLLATSCIALTAFASDEVYDEELDFTLSTEANVCCKAMNTAFGCANSGDNCVWVNRADDAERAVAYKYGSWCLSTRFLKCKKIDLLDKCSPDPPEPVPGVPTSAPTEKPEPVCIPDFDLYSVHKEMVKPNNRIGEVNFFDNNFYFDMTIQTPDKGASMPGFWNSVLSIGDNNTLSVQLMAKQVNGHRSGGLCIHLEGLSKECLGTKFVWTMAHNVRIQVYFKKEDYVKIVINRGKKDEYKEYGHKYGDHTPILASHPLTLPIYSGLGDDVATGVEIEKMKIKSWMVEMLQTKRKNMEHGMGNGNNGNGYGNGGGNGDYDEYEYEEYGEYEDLLFMEEDQERMAEEHMLNVGGFSVGFRHKVEGTAALDLKLLGVLLVVVLFGGGYYYYKSRQVKYVLLSGLDNDEV